MNDLLKNVIKRVREKSVNEEDEMKHIMQAYSKHRQVSAQESVARRCSLPMKCSWSVVFIPTDDDALEMSLPLSVLQNKHPDSEDVWMSGIMDKYRARPQTREFEKLSLACVERRTQRGFLMPVRAIVKAHQEKFEKHRNKVDKAFDQLQQQGPSENAWTAFAPEIEVDRLECMAEQEDINTGDENVEDDIPEYQILQD